MYYTGFADEAAAGIAGQIDATRELGWKWIEARAVDGCNLHDLPEEQFEAAAARLAESGIGVNCLGSAIANWSKDPFCERDFETTLGQLERALARMKRLNCTMLRGMSFRDRPDLPARDPELEANVFRKLRKMAAMCEDAGVLYLHENCNNYGGMSWKHTLKMLEQVDSPNFMLVFDTGNPVTAFDRSSDGERKPQDSWEFYRNVREFVRYVHIKDADYTAFDPEKGFPDARPTFPGEGRGEVRRIVEDLLANGYDGGFSIEPHMAPAAPAGLPPEEKARWKYDNYVEYGRRFMRMVDEIRAES
ncbi:MAG: sugar phosphate isomerase/epimerase [Lentisphaeria bacterium]|nr:sugar phosphate isomerase/epimerase [Lentisphaeria bacterium]